MTPARALALQLARARDERGWTQLRVARRLGVTKATVSAWENGTRSPRLSALVAWGGLFDLTIALTPRKERP